MKLVRLRRGSVALRKEVPVRGLSSASLFIRSLAAAADEIRGGEAKAAGPLPLGIALPGFLDERRRKIVRLSNLPFLDGAALASRLERALGTAVILDTDTNAGAVGEARLGAARGADRVLYVSAGTGLGAALAIRGRPVRVSHHTVGQVAHIPLSEAGPRCKCGRRGCAESLLSAAGILRRAGRRARSSPRELCEAAEEGDAEALEQWRETGRLLGRLLGILAALFSPEVAVIGGGIAGAANLFLHAAEKELRRTLPRSLREAVRLETARLGRYSGAAGAALLAAECGG